jgi:hypothetical protein
MTKLEKATNYLLKHPSASVTNLAKRIGVSYSYAYKLKQKVIAEIDNRLATPEQDAAMDALIATNQENGGWQVTATTGALNVQVGGDHYKKMKIQPIEYIHANNLPFIEGNIVKYITRWREKNGLKDLEKVKHYVDLLIDLEKL